MKKDVIITIKGLQNFDEAEDERNVELVTSGSFYEKNGNYYIKYKESELTGLGDTTTTVKVEKNKVTVIRFGELETHMIFEEGQKHISYYDMGFGSLTVGIATKKIDKILNDDGVKLKIDYSMEINNAATGENVLYMNVRAAGISN